MSLFVPVIVFGLGVWIYGLLMRHYALKRLTVTRSFDRYTVFRGETGEMVEVVRNRSGLPIPWLRVESRISHFLHFGVQDNLTVSGQMYHQSLFTLLPWRKITRRHKVTYLRRGAYNLGNAALTVGDLTGILTASRDQDMDVPLLVYPHIPDEEELPIPLSVLTGEWRLRRSLTRDPFLYRGLRDYAPGDPVRDIHWPATAKAGETLVRIHDPSARIRVIVLLNCQLKEKQWDNLNEEEQGPVEDLISLAAGLCIYAVRSGLTAGFIANMPIGESKECARLLEGEEETLLGTFARLRVLRVLSFTELLRTVQLPSDTDVVILSAYRCDADEEQAERLRDLGCRVTFYVPGEDGAAS